MGAIRWYELCSKKGSTISIAANNEAKAKEEAADRWGCGVDEVVCTGHKPFNTFLAQARGYY